MEKIIYAIDLKVYCTFPQDTCPFDLSECQRYGSISRGTYTIARNWTEEMFDEFVEYCNSNGDLIRMLGHYVMPTSEQPKSDENDSL